MAEDPLETGWRDSLALSSDIFGVLGGLVLVISFLSWLFAWLPSPVLLVCAGVSLALLCVWIMRHVFVSNNQSLQTIGQLVSNESKPTVQARVSAEPRRLSTLDELISPSLAHDTRGAPDDRLGYRVAEVRSEWKRLKLPQRDLVKRLFVLDELCGSQITDYLMETGIYQKTETGFYWPANLLSKQIPVDYLLEKSPLLERKDSDGGDWFKEPMRLDNVTLSWYSNCYWRLRPDLLEAIESVIGKQSEDNSQNKQIEDLTHNDNLHLMENELLRSIVTTFFKGDCVPAYAEELGLTVQQAEVFLRSLCDKGYLDYDYVNGIRQYRLTAQGREYVIRNGLMMDSLR